MKLVNVYHTFFFGAILLLILFSSIEPYVRVLLSLATAFAYLLVCTYFEEHEFKNDFFNKKIFEL